MWGIRFMCEKKNYLEETVCSNKAYHCHCICGRSFRSGRKRGEPCPQLQETCFCACCEIGSGLFRPQLKQTCLCWDRAEQRRAESFSWWALSSSDVSSRDAYICHPVAGGHVDHKSRTLTFILFSKDGQAWWCHFTLSSLPPTGKKNSFGNFHEFQLKCSSLHVTFVVRCFGFLEVTWVLLAAWGGLKLTRTMLSHLSTFLPLYSFFFFCGACSMAITCCRSISCHAQPCLFNL